MALHIRDVDAADAAAVVDILNPIIRTGLYTVLDTPFTVAAERDFIAGFPARGIWKVAVDDDNGRIVAFQVLEPFASYTHAFDHVGTLGTYVDLARRGEGIAARLFDATFTAARANGYEKLFTFVRADNPAALHTYKRHGFTVIGTAARQARIAGRYVDEILIERWLGDA